MIFESKFSIGDVAYGLSVWKMHESATCPLCGGTKFVAIVGSGEKARCPKCNHLGQIPLPTQSVGFAITELTLKFIRITHADRYGKPSLEISYMAEETGVSTGPMYAEASLYVTEQDALVAAYEAGARKEAREYR